MPSSQRCQLPAHLGSEARKVSLTDKSSCDVPASDETGASGGSFSRAGSGTSWYLR